MRVVLVHRYFAPDTPPYAHILRGIAFRLGGAGHDVTVLTCQPSYNRAAAAKAAPREWIAPRVQVRRWRVLPDRRFGPLKIVNLVWFCLRLTLARRRLGRVDVMMAASTPPIAVATVVRRLARRSGAKFVYHKQDIYPEVVTAPGILRAGRWASILRWLDSRTDRAADRVVVLSQDMADTVIDRGVHALAVEVINNFDPWLLDPSGAAPTSEREPRGPSHRLNVVFAGNLGRFQNLETVMSAAELLRADPINFHFFGTGALAGELARRVRHAGLANTQLHGYVTPEDLAVYLRREADIGIVSLMPGVIRAAYPSKTMSYLRQGCPVLALVEPDSDLASAINKAQAGFQVDPSDPHAVAELLRRLARDSRGLVQAGANAADLYVREFSPLLQLERWLAIFAALEVERIGMGTEHPGTSRRLIGRVLAALGLVITSPLLVLSSIAIKLSSRGPVLYRAPRAGIAGTNFTMYKFRTMNQASDESGARITGSSDSRVFPVGRWLRRFKVDELPQLINVVGGTMALTGPRPEDPTIVAEHYTPFMRESLTVLPGLTSPGSLAYYAEEARLPETPLEAEQVYLAETLPQKIALDLVYVHNRSWRYDAELVIRTVCSIAGVRRLFAKRSAWEQAEAKRLLLQADRAMSAREGTA